MAKRICSLAGCDRPHRARGLCATHWNATHRKDQHRAVPCTVCGRSVVKNGPGTKRRAVCSDRCRTYLTFGHWPEQGKELVGPVERHTVAEPEVLKTASRIRFVGTTCAWCGKQFLWDRTITGTDARRCSKRCTRKTGRAVRRAKAAKAGGTYTWAEVMRIFLAHDKRCAYCHEPVEGQPDPDHVVPLSRGGSNSITNVVPCCRPCNADKSNHLLSEWNTVRASRGKPPRDVSLADYPHLTVTGLARAA